MHLILAQEVTQSLDLAHKIRGYAVVAAAVILFCGSVYMVLATDVGARLSFLVSFASVTGFLTLLGIVWFCSLTPLSALHGPEDAWVVRKVVDNPAQAGIPAVATIEQTGNVLDATAIGVVEPSVDTAVTASGGPFQLFNSTDQYVVIGGRDVGGGNLSFFRHRSHYTVMEIQAATTATPLPGGAPPLPKPDPTKKPKYVVAEEDLGAIRQPPIIMSSAMGLLFALSLFGLHRVERADQRAKKAELEPVPTV